MPKHLDAERFGRPNFARLMARAGKNLFAVHNDSAGNGAQDPPTNSKGARSISEEMKKSPPQELTVGIIDRINQAHANFLRIGAETSSKMIELTNAAREVGVYVAELRQDGAAWRQLEFGGEIAGKSLSFDFKRAKAFLHLA